MRLYASWRADSPVAVLRGRTMRQHRSSGMPQIRFRTSNALPVKALATSGSVATASSSWNCARNLRCSGVDPGVTVSRGTILRLAQPYTVPAHPPQRHANFHSLSPATGRSRSALLPSHVGAQGAPDTWPKIMPAAGDSGNSPGAAASRSPSCSSPDIPIRWLTVCVRDGLGWTGNGEEREIVGTGGRAPGADGPLGRRPLLYPLPTHGGRAEPKKAVVIRVARPPPVPGRHPFTSATDGWPPASASAGLLVGPARRRRARPTSGADFGGAHRPAAIRASAYRQYVAVSADRRTVRARHPRGVSDSAG